MAKFKQGDLVLQSTQQIIQGNEVILDEDGSMAITSVALNFGSRITEFDTDTSLEFSSDSRVPTQNAVKTYVDNAIGGITQDHNDLINLQGGDATTSEFYHLTKSIHDGLFSESPTIGLGTTDTNIKVDYGNDLITMENNSGMEIFRSRVQTGYVITNIGDWLGSNYISLADNGASGSVGIKTGNSLAFYLSLNTQRIGPSTSDFMEINQTSHYVKISFDGAPNVEHIFNSNGLQLSATGATVSEFSIDGTLDGDTDTVVPTEKAVKTYVDNAISNLNPDKIWEGDSYVEVIDDGTASGYVTLVSNNFEVANLNNTIQSFGLTGEDTLIIDQTSDNIVVADDQLTVLSIIEDGIKLISGATVNEFSTDGTLADDSDEAVPTEKAIKTYVDNHAAVWG